MKINSVLSTTLNKSQYEKSKVKDHSFQKAFEKAQETKDKKKLMKTCKQFEAIFINMMMKSMRKTIHEDGIIEKSYGREIFEDMLDEKLAEESAKGQGFGLARQMYKQLSKNMK
ncbi:rod-binding protein [Crassaminicella indica]|uniref:Rod-binding protein n=1 Tax=Crassaminicella indica TaxID=2855394 RepID=A0ABX8RCC5_9CLOT|nr:rod-binding protein [Crassaminicella indica]QXM06694.1 rod-binding protein [Crassaminicella indica]